MKFSLGQYKFATTVIHQGVVIALASWAPDATGRGSIRYSVLRLTPDATSDDAAWTDPEPLPWPSEIRPAGMRLVTLNVDSNSIAADLQFCALSDGAHIFVFRQSTAGTLLVNRFIYDAAAGRLAAATEVRYRRSRNPDIPAGPGDTLGTRDMEGTPFIEPTTELTFVKDLQNGWFTVLMLPTQLQSVSRWQILACNTNGNLDSYTVLRSSDGLFDFSDSIEIPVNETPPTTLDPSGLVPPNQSFSLTSPDGFTLSFASGPAAILYFTQEASTDDYGRQQLFKREARVMVAIAVTRSDGSTPMAIVDFGVGQDGRLAQVANVLSLMSSPAPLGDAPIFTALSFTSPSTATAADGTAMTVQAIRNAPTSAGTFELWVQVQALGPNTVVVAQHTGDSGTEAANFCIAIDPAGTPLFQVTYGGQTSTVQGKTLERDTWYHLAAVWDLSAAAELYAVLYVNGYPTTTPGTLDVPTRPPGLVVGGAEDGFTGLVDELRLWNVARSQDWILLRMCGSPYLPNDDLVGYWPLDEPAPQGGLAPATAPNCSGHDTPDATVDGAMWVPTNAPRGTGMPVVAWDTNGLTAAATLLPYAQTTTTPFLLAGGDGLVHLYFQNAADDLFMAAHYGTTTSRAQYTTTWTAANPDGSQSQQGTVRWFARQAGSVMNPTTTAPFVVIIAQPAPGLYTLTLKGASGYTEEWPSVPATLSSFLAVVNGDALQSPTSPVDVPSDAVVYDYTKVQVTPAGGQMAPPPGPGTGSGLFTVGADTIPDNGWTAIVDLAGPSDPPVLDRAAIDCCWLAVPPPLALSLNPAGTGDQYVQVLPEADMASYDGPLNVEGDLCLEAWINPVAYATTSSPIVVFNNVGNDGAAYMIGLDPQGYLFATNGEVAGWARFDPNEDTKIPSGELSHIAANYRTDYGIHLSGTSYLDAGNNTSLNLSDALTIEGWVRLDSVDEQQTLISKWDENTGASWRLYVDEDGCPVFDVSQSTGSATTIATVRSTETLSAGEWHHLAGVYDISTEQQVVVSLVGPSGGSVSFADAPDAPTGSVTIEFWCQLPPPILSCSNPSVSFYLLTTTGPSVSFNFSYQGNRKNGNMAVLGPGHYPVQAQTTRELPVGWTHVAGTYDATDSEHPFCLYINGVLEEIELTGSGGFDLFPITSYKVLGQCGSLNELRLWDRTLTPDEIRQNMKKPLIGIEQGLVGYWPMNDRFGTTVMDRTMRSNGTLGGGAAFTQLETGSRSESIYLDGTLQASRSVDDAISPSSTPVRLGADAQANYLQGTIDDVRIWDVGRIAWQIQEDLTNEVGSHTEGLVSAWNFDTKLGAVAPDAHDSNDAVITSDPPGLSEEEIDAMWVPTPLKAGWSLLVNGVEVPVLGLQRVAAGAWRELPSTLPDISAPPEVSPPSLPQTAQCTLGAALDPTVSAATLFTGVVREVRVWDRRRTAEEILDNMYRPLTGSEPGLMGYWPADDGSGTIVSDRTGNGTNGQFTASEAPKWIVSNVRVRDEPPCVKLVFFPWTVEAADRAISGTPGLGEYGDLEVDTEGTLVGVLKWATVFVDSANALNLLTGYKVGDLALQYVGQVQTRPTIVGYIEGAPPLPSENLTVDSPVTPYKYLAASAVTLTDAEETAYVFTASRDTGFDQSYELKSGWTWGLSLFAWVGVGAGEMTEFASYSSRLGFHTVVNNTYGWLADAVTSETVATTVPNTIEVFGAWKDKQYRVDPNAPRYYLPNNKGYALVKSGTADLYALRLQGSGVLVSYFLLPNPDIPEDTNVIMFYINPKYTKNGTLDGWFGFQADEDYPELQPGEFGSYFNPLEAYALKRQVAREQASQRRVYEQFEPEPTAGKDPSSIEEHTNNLARRSLANTYVWNSDGGLYAEEEQVSSLREESRGASYEFLQKAGVYAGVDTKIGFEFAFDALLGGHIRTKVVKTKREGASFGVSVRVPGEGFLNKRLALDGIEPPLGAYPVPYDAQAAAGKVNQYRFMTFYLSPSKQSFDDLAGIIDPDWLNRQGSFASFPDPDAVAMKEALSNPNEVWRVLHRVTYVNRVLDTEVPPDKGESMGPDVQWPEEDSVAANVLLISALPLPPVAANPIATIASELSGVLTTLEQDALFGDALEAAASVVSQMVMDYMQFRPYAPLAALEMLPPAASISIGSTLQFQALGVYKDDIKQDLTSYAQWSSTELDIAAVTSTGEVSGVDAGLATIKATYGGFTASAQVRVS